MGGCGTITGRFVGISARQIGQVSLTLAQWVMHSLWKRCFWLQGRTMMISFRAMLWQQMLQFPQTFLMSYMVAVFSATFISPPPLFLQKQQYTQKRQQKIGTRTTKIINTISTSSLSPMRTVQVMRKGWQSPFIGYCASVMIDMMREVTEISELKRYPPTVLLNRYETDKDTARLVARIKVFFVTQSTSDSLMFSLAKKIVPLTQSSILEAALICSPQTMWPLASAIAKNSCGREQTTITWQNSNSIPKADTAMSKMTV